MRILYLTRKFPPSTGGMETASHELWKALSRRFDVRLVASSLSPRWLPAVAVYLTFKCLAVAVSRRPDVIYVQDGVLAPIGRLLSWTTGIPTVLTVHGLEVTYSNGLYRRLVLPWIGRQSAVVTVSRATAAALREAVPGAPDPVVIPNGLPNRFPAAPSRAEARLIVSRLLGLSDDSEGPILIHTNGRLIRRKGVFWFIKEVFPAVVEAAGRPTYYMVSGTGPEEARIRAAVKELALQDRVRLLGRVSDEELAIIYTAADLFVMPNIAVDSDIEGFGLVGLEAASFGTPVLASDREGISDAIKHGANGILVPCGDSRQFQRAVVDAVRSPSLSRDDVRRFTVEKFSWDRVASEYEAVFHRVAQSEV